MMTQLWMSWKGHLLAHTLLLPSCLGVSCPLLLTLLPDLAASWRAPLPCSHACGLFFFLLRPEDTVSCSEKLQC